MKLVIDIEGNGLLNEVSQLWCIVAENLDTGQIYKFSDHDTQPYVQGTIRDGVGLMQNAEMLVAHNGLGYDWPAIDKLYGTDLVNHPNLVDTFVMSKVLCYTRSFTRGHGLKDWGIHLGCHKGDYDDWSKYTREMLRYCVQDVNVNVKIYDKLMEELRKHKAASGSDIIEQGLKIEHDAGRFNATAMLQGWKFATAKAEKNMAAMQVRMDEIEKELLPRLGTKTIFTDKEPKKVKFKANADYNTHTTRWLSDLLGFPVAAEDTHILGSDAVFQRTSEKQIELGQIRDVKEWLEKNGWKPDDYTRKLVNGQWHVVSPKLTDTSLEAMPPVDGHEVGKMVSEWLTVRNRRNVIQGWFPKISEGRIRGGMMIQGTPSFRCTHKDIANLPAVSSPWGQELRELLEADDGRVIVGADSSGNQLRGLVHYVNNEDFTKEVIFGDQHTRNAETLGCSRSTSKTFLYAFLFGAGNAKLGHALTGKNNANLGKKKRADFAKSIKGMEGLIDNLNRAWNARQKTWIKGLDTRKVFVDSEHKLLNYLLQSAEAITCKAALSYALAKIKEEGLDAKPRIFYHDEFAFDASVEDSVRVGEVLKEAFAEGPKLFGVNVMDGGDPMIGKSYADVH